MLLHSPRSASCPLQGSDPCRLVRNHFDSPVHGGCWRRPVGAPGGGSCASAWAVPSFFLIFLLRFALAPRALAVLPPSSLFQHFLAHANPPAWCRATSLFYAPQASPPCSSPSALLLPARPGWTLHEALVPEGLAACSVGSGAAGWVEPLVPPLLFGPATG